MKYQAIQISSQYEIGVNGQCSCDRVVNAWICSSGKKISSGAIEACNVKRGSELRIEGHGEEVIFGRKQHKRLTGRLNELDDNDQGGDNLVICDG